MSNIVPFNAEGNLPAYMTREGGMREVNKDVAMGASFPTMSIKGIKFTISRDGVRKILTKPDDPDEVAQSIGVVILRANTESKVFYLKKFAEGDSDGARPDCYSFDSVAPSPNSPNPQSKKCGICPHNVWGSRVGDGDGDKNPDGTERKGKACADNARLAIAAPDKLNEAMLLRVPPGSLRNLRDAVKLISQRKIQYNAVVMKISFDREMATPKLVFKPVGLLPDDAYAISSELYEDEVVRAIVGADDHGVDAVSPEPKAGAVAADELDAALAARDAVGKAKVAPQAPAAPVTPPVEDIDPDEAAAVAAEKAAADAKAKAAASKKAKAEKAAAEKAATPAPTKPAAAPPASSGASSLLSDLDDLLGGKDD